MTTATLPAPKTELQQRFNEAKVAAAKADATHWKKCAEACAEGGSLSDKELAKLVDICDRRKYTLELFEADCEVLREERVMRPMLESAATERAEATETRNATAKRAVELQREVSANEAKNRAAVNTIARVDELRQRYQGLLRMNPRVLGVDFLAAVQTTKPAVTEQEVGRMIDEPVPMYERGGLWLPQRRDI